MAGANRGRKHIFDNPTKRAEMLAYRAAGYTYPELALYYGVHHTTILYHCRKAGFMKSTRGEGEKMALLIKAGKTIDEVAKMYSVPSTVISSHYARHCARLGLKGFKILHNDQKLVLRLPISFRRKKRAPKKPKIYKYVRTPPSPRPGWLKEAGVWVCVGKKIDQVREEQEKRQKRDRDFKKIEMLNY